MTNTENIDMTVRHNYLNEEIDIAKIIEEYLLRLIEKELIG